MSSECFRMQRVVQRLVCDCIQFHLVLSEDGSGRGAALAAAVASTSDEWQRQKVNKEKNVELSRSIHNTWCLMVRGRLKQVIDRESHTTWPLAFYKPPLSRVQNEKGVFFYVCSYLPQSRSQRCLVSQMESQDGLLLIESEFDSIQIGRIKVESKLWTRDLSKRLGNLSLLS